MIHHHHVIEEELLFPFYESKMGANAMGDNLEQHHRFRQGLADLEMYIKEVMDGKTIYSGDLVISKLDNFADDMVKHLHDVRCFPFLHARVIFPHEGFYRNSQQSSQAKCALRSQRTT